MGKLQILVEPNMHYIDYTFFDPSLGSRKIRIKNVETGNCVLCGKFLESNRDVPVYIWVGTKMYFTNVKFHMCSDCQSGSNINLSLPVYNQTDEVDPMDLQCAHNICFSLWDGRPEDTIDLISEDLISDRNKNFKKQRIERGFDDSETWSLSYVFARFMYPRLIRYKEVAEKIIGDVDHWNHVNNVIKLCELFINEDDYDWNSDQVKSDYELYKQSLSIVFGQLGW